MGERTLRPEEMATTSAAVSTVAPPLQEEPEPVAVITLRPTATRAQQRKKVVWTEDTVDNENMNKKKSKCCCIYEKPHKFGESDSEDSEDECEHCFGHVERRHQHHRPSDTTTESQETSTAEQPASITLKPSEPAPAQPVDRPAPSS